MGGSAGQLLWNEGQREKGVDKGDGSGGHRTKRRKGLGCGQKLVAQNRGKQFFL